MERLLGFAPKELGSLSTAPSYNQTVNNDVNVLVIQNSFNSGHAGKGDKVDLSFGDIYKSLSITAREILDKINEYIKEEAPEGVQGLKPQDVTPEATADRIVSGATAFFDLYARQNPELEGEELLDSFMETIRGGVDKGYGEAVDILEGLGAFDVEGVKASVEETKRLVDEKLAAYETHMRKELGIDKTDVEEEVAAVMREAALSQVGYEAVDLRA